MTKLLEDLVEDVAIAVINRLYEKKYLTEQRVRGLWVL